MASFLDKTPQFNPYIKQLPTEEMVQVGMTKQAQYDQGVQRIQSQVDQVAGMDIARGMDQKYVQAKLDSLGDNLRTVAAGDFSNYQLVNSVGGMTSQIAKDDRVRNAVASTQMYRKGQQDMQAADKAGKGSPSNSWYFQKGAAEYMNSEDPDAVFNQSYKPYSNYQERAKDAIQSLIPNIDIQDNSFSIGKDENGKTVVTIHDATIRQELTRVSPEQVQRAVMSALTPADMEQLSIDGMYSYANMQPEQFAESVSSSYEKNYNEVLQKRNDQQAALGITPDVHESQAIIEKITSLDSELLKIQEEYTNISKGFAEGETDQAKASLYTRDYINNLALGFSYTQRKETHHTNPYKETRLKEATIEQRDRHFAMTYNLDYKKYLISKATLQLKVDEFKAEQFANGGVNATMPLGMFEHEKGSVTKEDFYASIGVMEDAINDGDGKIQDFYKLDDETWKTVGAAWEQGVNFKTGVQDYLDNTWDLRRNYQLKKNLIETIEAEATEKHGDITQHIPAELNTPISHVTSSGQSYNYSSEEILEVIHKMPEVTSSEYVQNPLNGMSIRKDYFDEEKAASKLSAKEYEIARLYRPELFSDPLTSSEQALKNKMTKLDNVASDAMSNLIEARDTYIDEQLSERTLGYEARGIPMSFQHDKEYEGNFRSQLGNIFQEAKKKGGGIAMSPEYTQSAAETLLVDPELVVSYRKVPQSGYNQGNTNELTLVGKTKSFTMIISDDKMKALAAGKDFEPSADTKKLMLMEDFMRAKRSTTTATDGGLTTLTNTILAKPDFPLVNLYGITGNMEKTTNGYVLQVNIFEPDGTVHPAVEISNDGKPFAPQQVIHVMNGITDDYIFQLLDELKRSMSREDLEELNNQSKNPSGNGRQ